MVEELNGEEKVACSGMQDTGGWSLWVCNCFGTNQENLVDVDSGGVSGIS